MQQIPFILSHWQQGSCDRPNAASHHNYHVMVMSFFCVAVQTLCFRSLIDVDILMCHVCISHAQFKCILFCLLLLSWLLLVQFSWWGRRAHQHWLSRWFGTAYSKWKKITSGDLLDFFYLSKIFCWKQWISSKLRLFLLATWLRSARLNNKQSGVVDVFCCCFFFLNKSSVI